MKQKIAQTMASKDSHIRLLFATEAYSMGTDVPDIRRIIHVGPPTCLESEYLLNIFPVQNVSCEDETLGQDLGNFLLYLHLLVFQFIGDPLEYISISISAFMYFYLLNNELVDPLLPDLWPCIIVHILPK